MKYFLVAAGILALTGCSRNNQVPSFEPFKTYGQIRAAQDGKEESVVVGIVDLQCNPGYQPRVTYNAEGYIVLWCQKDPK